MWFSVFCVVTQVNSWLPERPCCSWARCVSRCCGCVCELSACPITAPMSTQTNSSAHLSLQIRFCSRNPSRPDPADAFPQGQGSGLTAQSRSASFLYMSHFLALARTCITVCLTVCQADVSSFSHLQQGEIDQMKAKKIKLSHRRWGPFWAPLTYFICVLFFLVGFPSSFCFSFILLENSLLLLCRGVLGMAHNLSVSGQWSTVNGNK